MRVEFGRGYLSSPENQRVGQDRSERVPHLVQRRGTCQAGPGEQVRSQQLPPRTRRNKPVNELVSVTSLLSLSWERSFTYLSDPPAAIPEVRLGFNGRGRRNEPVNELVSVTSYLSLSWERSFTYPSDPPCCRSRGSGCFQCLGYPGMSLVEPGRVRHFATYRRYPQLTTPGCLC
jgi:hypothetical protein